MTSGYRLPRSIADRLSTALQGRKNAPAALALAEWLARMWSAPRRLLYAFPVDRRAIAGREDLGLTEARVRGALTVLEEIGFLARYEPDPGKRYQRTKEGLHRRPILFRFGEEYGPAFAKANALAQAARAAPAPARRPIIARPEPLPAVLNHSADRQRPSREREARPLPQLAQKQNLGGSHLLMGEQNRTKPMSPLEAAIERLRRGIGA
jgi:hypothetical protein